MYADRTHHGKEEDILFRDLEKKSLSPNHNKIINELVEEHIWARATVGKLVDVKNQYVKGNVKVLDEIVNLLSDLVEFYPKFPAPAKSTGITSALDSLIIIGKLSTMIEIM